MRLSLQNAVTATGEYLAHTFGNMKPSIVSGVAAVIAHYKLHKSGTEMMKILADEDGYIDLDVLEQGIKTYMSGLGDETFKTPIGDIKIGASTPMELLDHLKKYGEN